MSRGMNVLPIACETPEKESEGQRWIEETTSGGTKKCLTLIVTWNVRGRRVCERPGWMHSLICSRESHSSRILWPKLPACSDQRDMWRNLRTRLLLHCLFLCQHNLNIFLLEMFYVDFRIPVLVFEWNLEGLYRRADRITVECAAQEPLLFHWP